MAEDFLVAFDLELMRPACPLVAATLGADTHVPNLFPPESWVLVKSHGMHVYPTTAGELKELVRRIERRMGV